MSRAATFIAVTLLAFANGCASIAPDSDGQAVWIRSEPPGADVKLQGRIAGRTPLYAVVPRERRPHLYLSREGVEKDVVLKTNYRWQASFFSNLIFWIFAPVGWTVDLINGSAWNPHDPPVTNFEHSKSVTTLTSPAKVAIAPPLADSLPRSDESVPLLLNAAKPREISKSLHPLVYPYDSTLNLFLQNGYDFDGEGSYDDKRTLYAHLDADAVWFSKLTSQSDGMHLDAVLEDKRTQKPVDHLHLLVDAPEGLSESYERTRRIFGLPNAISIALTSQKFEIDNPPLGTVSLQPAFDKGWVNQSLNYLSAISITTIPAYRSGRSGRWIFSFFPILRVSHRDFVARGTPDVNGQDFSRWLFAIGYGPEIGYQFGRSYVYANALLNEVWTEVKWNFRQRDFSETGSSMLISTELGYLYTFNKFWSVRLFVTAQPENASVWRTALAKSSTSGLLFSDPNGNLSDISTVGLSVGYSFEPFLVHNFHLKSNARAQ